MTLPTILLPLFVQVLLTFGLLIWMGFMRRKDIKDGVVRPQDVALREPKWSGKTLQVVYCFSNQFELPVLFYVLTILEIMTRHADFVFVVLAWIFVLSRIAHAYEHTTSNVVLRRGFIYGIGMAALMLAWLIFIIRILFGLS